MNHLENIFSKPLQKAGSVFTNELLKSGPLKIFAVIAAGAIPILCRLDGILNFPPNDKIFVCFLIVVFSAAAHKLADSLPMIVKSCVKSILFLSFSLFIAYFCTSARFVLVRNDVRPEDKSAPSVFYLPSFPSNEFKNLVIFKSGCQDYYIGFRQLVDNDFYWLSDKLGAMWWNETITKVVLLLLIFLASISLTVGLTLIPPKSNSSGINDGKSSKRFSIGVAEMDDSIK